MNSHDNPSLRVMSLHALAYCPRLFYLEEVEEIRVADDRVYAGRELHSSLAADKEGEQTQLELADPELGLVGKVDAIRRRDGSLLPYEHKRGRCQKEGKSATAWPSDRLQVIAYAALIQSVTGQPVAEGRIRYHADNTTVRVPFDDAARQDLADAIATARRLRESTERPPVAENERLCVHCSLAPVCLPEEVRQAEHPEREPCACSRRTATAPASTSSSRARMWDGAANRWSFTAPTIPQTSSGPCANSRRSCSTAPRRSRPRRSTSAQSTMSPCTG